MPHTQFTTCYLLSLDVHLLSQCGVVFTAGQHEKLAPLACTSIFEVCSLLAFPPLFSSWLQNKSNREKTDCTAQ